MRVPDNMVSRVLPQAAVNRLRAAAETGKRAAVEAAIVDVKLMYPQFFKEQEK